MQHFEFMNWWIRGFVFLMSRTGYISTSVNLMMEPYISFAGKIQKYQTYILGFTQHRFSWIVTSVLKLYNYLLCASVYIYMYCIIIIYFWHSQWKYETSKNCGFPKTFTQLNARLKILLNGWLMVLGSTSFGPKGMPGRMCDILR